MSHHGPEEFDGRSPEFEKLLRELHNTASYRGATDSFPHGKLTPRDEGAIQFGVGEKDGKVVLDFGTPVTWVGMTAQDAADLASVLMRHARSVGRKQGQTITMTIGG